MKALKGPPLAVSRSPGPPGLPSVFSLGCRAIEHIGIEFEFVDYTEITSPMRVGKLIHQAAQNTCNKQCKTRIVGIVRGLSKYYIDYNHSKSGCRIFGLEILIRFCKARFEHFAASGKYVEIRGLGEICEGGQASKTPHLRKMSLCPREKNKKRF